MSEYLLSEKSEYTVDNKQYTDDYEEPIEQQPL